MMRAVTIALAAWLLAASSVGAQNLNYSPIQGPTGTTGTAGATGAAGAMGSPGTTGSTGPTGANGTAATVTVGATSTLSAGSAATVANSGTTLAAILNFGIPQGAAGATGPTGSAGVNAFGSPTTRALSLATAYQAITTSKPAVVTVNLTSSASLSLTGGSTNSANVVIGSTNGVAGGTGTAVCTYSNANTGTLTIGLALNQIFTESCTFALPVGWYFSVIQTSGTVSILSAFDQSVG